MDRDAAETIALQALAFLAEDPERLARFLLASGLDPSDVRARAATPELQCAILEYLANDESQLLVFAANCQVAPESIAPAIAALQELPA
jgi:hypothetical protein